MNDMKLLEAQLPTGWAWQRISDTYRVTKKPRELVLAEYDAIPFVPMEAVPVNGREDVRFELRSPQQISSGTYFEKGDVLLSKITPSFENGKQGLAKNFSAPFGVASTEIIPLQPLNTENNSRFLFYYLLHPEVRTTLAGKMEGSTGRQRVPEHAVRDFPMPVPPKAEQKKIAAVLWKVQRAIEVEEKLISTARELKKSAMRQLFTRGLRGEPQKETEISPLPESWEILPLETACDFASGGTPSKARPEFWNGAIPWASPKDMKRPRLRDTQDHISQAGLQAGTTLVPANSLLVVIRGMILMKDVPVALTEVPMAFNQDIKAILPREQLAPDFLLYTFEAFRHLLFQKVGRSAHGTRTLLSHELASFLIPFPLIDEQQDIASVLQTIDRKISVHERKRATLQELFKTLLHQLMTGQIRVHDLDIDTSDVEEVA